MKTALRPSVRAISPRRFIPLYPTRMYVSRRHLISPPREAERDKRGAGGESEKGSEIDGGEER